MKILWLALAYFVAGKLGLLLAVPPGYATAVFPSSGIALAAVILLGFRVWPGVFLGSFMLNLSVSINGSGIGTLTETAIIAAGIGVGAATQAVIAAALVRRFVSIPISFDRGRQVAAMLFWGGPVVCLVNSVIGVSVVVAAGKVPLANFPFNAATWWIGDTFGVLIFAPLVLVWAQQRGPDAFRNNMMITVPAAATFIAAVAAVWYASSWEKSRLQHDFEDQAGFLAAALGRSLGANQVMMETLHGFVASAERVERDRFGAFAGALLSDQTTVQAVSWNPRVLHADRQAFEAAARASGQVGFRLTERNDQGQLVSAAQREEYIAVLFIEPVSPNRAAIGYDIASDEVRRAAVAQARDSGRLVSSERIRLVQESGDQFGALLLHPVYEGFVPADDLAAKRQTLRGYVVGVIRFADLISESFAGLNTDELVFHFRDVTQPEDPKTLYASPTIDRWVPQLRERGFFGGTTPLLVSRSYTIGQRTWSFEIAPTQAYIARHRPENAWLILTGGLLIASLVVAFSIVFVSRDQQLRKLVDQLSETQDRLMLILSSAAEAIFGIDKQWACTFCNPAALRVLGYDHEDQLIGQNMHETVHHSHADGSHYPVDACEIIAAVHRDKGVHVDNEVMWRKDGTAFPVEYWSYPIQTGGETVGAVVTFLDITERLQAEEKLREAEKLAALSQMTGGVAHEFNNLFMAVSGNLELIRNSVLHDQEARQRVDRLLEVVFRGGELTQSMLTYVGQQPMATAAVDPADATRQTINMLKPALGVAYELVVRSPNRVWPVIVDLGKLQSAIVNLVRNACDATPDGGEITVEMRNLRAPETEAMRLRHGMNPCDCVMISVTDPGEGMPPDVVERARDPFFTTKEVGKGTGLGLSMVDGFARQMGGHVEIASRPGEGTSVAMYLPRAMDERRGPATDERRPNIVDGQLEDLVALIVEDEPVVLDVIAGFAEREGCAVYRAASGDEALTKAREIGRVDLLVTDVVMPGSLDGTTLATIIRKEFPESNIILMTGYTETTIEQMGISLGDMHVLHKPFQKEELVRAIKTASPKLFGGARD